jgi:N-acetylmuramic acid 6-phosphate etherase
VANRLPPTEELHPRASNVHSISTVALVRRLHREDVRAVRATAATLEGIARIADEVARTLAQGGRLIYVGAGTSGRLGVLDAAECPPTFGTEPWQVQAVLAGGPLALLRAVEGAEDNPRSGAAALKALRVGPKDIVCGISASASTPFVLGALEAARARKCRTVLVTCNPRAPRSAAHVVLLADTGPELIEGSTRLKAGTATKLILNALSTAAMVRLGRIHAGRMVKLLPINKKLRARAARIRAELGQSW